MVTLQQMASTLNEIGKNISDNRRQFFVLLAETRERVKRETNMSFIQWCNEYLRRPDGTLYKSATLYRYCWIGRNPDKIDEYLNTGRLSTKKVQKANQLAHRILHKSTSIPDEVNFLMTAWEHAGEEARTQFLNLINAKLEIRRKA